MDFHEIDDDGDATGPTAISFSRRADGSAQRIAASVYAPSSFSGLGVKRFTFEVCRLENGKASTFDCSREEYVAPVGTSQREGSFEFTISDGAGTYRARLVHYGAFGARDDVYSSSTFEVR